MVLLTGRCGNHWLRRYRSNKAGLDTNLSQLQATLMGCRIYGGDAGTVISVGLTYKVDKGVALISII